MADVVGAAIVQHGCVLAARRTSPPEAAGRWEFPGGKVEPAESRETGLVREIAEELDCVITVDSWLPLSSPIDTEHTLTVAIAHLADGAEPSPTEHDQLRWITPEELGELDWLPADRPFLPALREVLLDGEPLGDGSGAVRIGQTVRRAVGPLTPAVHALLHHLDRSLVEGIPRVHGVDARGREVLDLLPGEPVADLEDAHLIAMVRMLDEINTGAAGFRHVLLPELGLFSHDGYTPDAVRFTAPDDSTVAGVTGWHRLAITHPTRQLAHLAWSAVPLDSADVAEEAVVERLELISREYDGPSAREILAAVEDRVAEAMVVLSAEDRDRTEKALADFRRRRSGLDRRLAAREDQAS